MNHLRDVLTQLETHEVDLVEAYVLTEHANRVQQLLCHGRLGSLSVTHKAPSQIVLTTSLRETEVSGFRWLWTYLFGRRDNVSGCV